MKTILIFLILISACFAQEARTWTDTQGREVFGKMVGKDHDSVKVLIDRDEFDIPLEKLSKEDFEYVAQTKILSKVNLRVRTIASSSATERSKSKRKIKVSVSRVDKRNLTVKVFWIGEGYKKELYGLYTKEEKKISNDGDLFFEVVYPNNLFLRGRFYNCQHKSHIIVVYNGEEEVGRYESLGLKDVEKYIK